MIILVPCPSIWKKAKSANFADDNEIHANSVEMETLRDVLERESERAIKWFKQNEMIVDREKFQSMVLFIKDNSFKT